MRTGLGWLVLLAPVLSRPAQEGSSLPVAPATRAQLRSLTTELAKQGEAVLVGRLRSVLAGLGEGAGELERWAKGWERTLAGAKPDPSANAKLAKKVERVRDELRASLGAAKEPERLELARWILELDSGEPEANVALGRKLAEDGRWLDPEALRWHLGEQAVARRVHGARALGIEVESGVSENAVLTAFSGGGSFARAAGAELHAALPAEKLAQTLREALRAAALSHALLGGELWVPKLAPRRIVMLRSALDYQRAADEAQTKGWITALDYQAVREHDLRSYHDSRGFRVANWRNEAELAALLLWESLGDWLGPDAQPCLRVGHLNWVCLRYLGSSMPTVAWTEVVGGEPEQRSVGQRSDGLQRAVLWRCARQRLWGSRAWMASEVRSKRDPPWARSMLDQDGKITDANLVKATLVAEFLQVEERLGGLARATRGAGGMGVEAMERALGERLPDFEARWRRWLVPKESQGVLQALRATPAAPAAGSRVEEACLRLAQARANALFGQDPEIQTVALDEDLSRAAELHARYLTRNPEQKPLWPQAHEEYSGSPGFTPEGALAGERAVIAYVGDPVAAVESWLWTFYHRLPLLDPGLFGVGIGLSEEVVVLDAGSLVLAPWKDHVVLWPLPGAEDVPIAFTPELPNPVPSADPSTLGTCISVQLFLKEQRSELALTLELFRGEPQAANLVDCHLLSPTAPLQTELAPRNAWGLLPKRHLAPKTLYTARARWSGGERQWSFTTGG